MMESSISLLDGLERCQGPPISTKRHFVALALAFTFLFIALSGCNRPPGATQAERQFREAVKRESNNRIDVVKFRKTNGRSGNLFGVMVYMLDYDAEIVFTEDCVWRRGMTGWSFPGTTEPIPKEAIPKAAPSGVDEYLNSSMENALSTLSNVLAGPGERKKKGDRHRISSKMMYEKTERGWVLTEL